ncbi:heavy-metal-associated domain-containing protein [Thiohalomonas denitrificans]|uniref:Copper chaperone CopZ n=1 Tax=Thiohalomonas denitrificans TaxID=415747 RepID=A0A1G5PMA8_9GAMM|nr:heavy-metal-associated domain-containing protein [Thiohalomonas denitrificans]SCZ50593.1 Copper chaperone CopZ [Thiohalomonas denitrificans]
MQTEQFTVQNVKCAGCASNIENGLKELPGVSDVEVVVEGGTVTVKGDTLDRDQLSAKLTELGYPEA